MKCAASMFRVEEYVKHITVNSKNSALLLFFVDPTFLNLSEETKKII
jgi:hypothetical protein